MKFPELLEVAIGNSEIPLRFEPGAEEALRKPIVEMLKAWLESHDPVSPKSESDRGRSALIRELMEELDGVRDIDVS